MANYADITGLTTGSINCTNMIFMNHGERVASEPWVRDQLYDLWNAIGDVSRSAGEASRKGNAASIVKAEWIGKQGKYGGYSIGMRFTKGNGSTFDSNATGDLAGAYHGHKVDLNLSGVYLQATAAKYSGNGTTTYGKSINLSHKHDISGSGVDSSGILTIKWGATNFNSATDSTIDLSSWLRTQFKSFYEGITLQSVSPDEDTQTTTVTVTIGGPTVFGYTPSSRDLTSGTGVLSNYWKAAYNAGWDAAAEASGLNEDTDTVTYPISGGKTKSVTAKANASIDDDCDAAADSFTIEVGDIGSTAYGAPYHTGGAWIDKKWVSWTK